jgi:alkanesulfonate monooxygenase SsuD/methylene tetrahydromethanopterin reductase-like flavin-dependent oxidoreductase (luciferase family)
VPIIVGGHSPAAARRAGRLGDGFFPARGLSEELLDLARKTAIAHDRNPADLEITASMPDDVAEVPRLAALGVSRLLVPVTRMGGMAVAITSPEDALNWRATIEQFADE